MENDDEVLDLVNKKNEVIGQIKRKESYRLADTKLGFIRGTVAFIQNSKGQLWIPKRLPHKAVAPNGLDFSVAEHVGAGESTVEAVVRGFEEELFWKIKESDLKFLGSLSPAADIYWFTDTYLLKAEKVARYNKQDFSGFQWLFPDEIATLIKRGTLAKRSLLPALEMYFLS